LRAIISYRETGLARRGCRERCRRDLCGDREGNLYWKTPCERAPHHWTATTRADGSFELAGLPRLDLQLFILDPPFHTQTFIVSAALLGPTILDLGTREVRSTADRL
jgi:hypothetical protein